MSRCVPVDVARPEWLRELAEPMFVSGSSRTPKRLAVPLAVTNCHGDASTQRLRARCEACCRLATARCDFDLISLGTRERSTPRRPLVRPYGGRPTASTVPATSRRVSSARQCPELRWGPEHW